MIVGREEENYLVAIQTPYLSIYSLMMYTDSEKIEYRSSKLLYNSPVISNYKNPVVAMKYGSWLSILNWDLSKENNFVNVRMVNGKLNFIENLGHYEISLNYNKVYFNESFQLIKDVKIKCGVGMENSCYAFILGIKKSEFIENEFEDHQMGVLNLDHFEEASNKVLGIFSFGNIDEIKKIYYNEETEFFTLQLYSRFKKNPQIMNIVKSKAPLFHLNMSEIRDSESIGNIEIKANLKNYLENGESGFLEGVIAIHEGNKKIKYRLPEERKVIEKGCNEKLEYNLDKILKLKGWIYDLKLKTQEGKLLEKKLINKRKEKIEYHEYLSCLSKLKSLYSTVKVLQVIKQDKKLFIITKSGYYQKLTNLFIFQRNKEECKTQQITFRDTYVISLYLKKSKNLVLITEHYNTVTLKEEIHLNNIFFSEEKQEFVTEETKVEFPKMILTKINNINSYDDNKILFTFVKQEEFPNDKLKEEIMFLKFSISNKGSFYGVQSGNCPEKIGNISLEKITQIDSTASKGTVIVIVKTRFLNKLTFIKVDLFDEPNQGTYIRIDNWTVEGLILNNDENLTEIGLEKYDKNSTRNSKFQSNLGPRYRELSKLSL